MREIIKKEIEANAYAKNGGFQISEIKLQAKHAMIKRIREPDVAKDICWIADSMMQMCVYVAYDQQRIGVS
jgi:hypothetical protein